MANNYKVYGNERTNLTLSDKAQKAYGQSTYTIIEKEDGTYAYYDGAVSRHNLISEGLTAEEMNELLEQEYEDQMKAKLEEIVSELDSNTTLPEDPEAYALKKSLAQNEARTYTAECGSAFCVCNPADRICNVSVFDNAGEQVWNGFVAEEDLLQIVSNGWEEA